MEKERKVMRRSIMLTEEQERKIVNMRMDERYTRLSYAEIIRMLIEAGLERMRTERAGA